MATTIQLSELHAQLQRAVTLQTFLRQEIPDWGGNVKDEMLQRLNRVNALIRHLHGLIDYCQSAS